MTHGMSLAAGTKEKSACRAFAAYAAYPRHFAHLLMIGVVVLSAIDGLATLRLIDAGLEEVNPIMRLLLSWGPVPFLACKLLLTASGLAVILWAKGRPLFHGKIHSTHLLAGLATVYSGVIAYESCLAVTIFR